VAESLAGLARDRRDALDARVQRIGAELRCLVCRNQTIADSNAPLAADLRREVREQLLRGASDDEVLRFMTQRYGDFVRYRPPLQARTALLWAGPALLLTGGLGALGWVLRRRSTLAPERFEADAEDDAASAAELQGLSR
jgi:cytochrome c-type biogenesis protein CcmH